VFRSRGRVHTVEGRRFLPTYAVNQAWVKDARDEVANEFMRDLQWR
jgi:hypothetical protein